VTKIFGPSREDVTRGWRRPNAEKTNNLYSLPDIIRIVRSRMIWAEKVARVWEKRKAYKDLV
jgi:hypothetical protein